MFDVPATLDASAWYFGNTMLLTAIVVGLALWGFYTSVGGRVRMPAEFSRSTVE